MKGALSRWTILLLTVCIAGCSGAPTRPESCFPTPTSGGLRADVMNRTLRLIPRADGSLGLQYRLLGLFPIRIEELDGVGISRADVAGREILTARMYGREFPIGERMRPVPVPARWLGRTGEYEIANPGEDAVLPERVRLRADGGFLFVDYSIPVLFPGTASFAVAPASDTEAVIRGFGRGMGETIRVVTVSGEEMLSYSGYLLRKKESNAGTSYRTSSTGWASCHAYRLVDLTKGSLRGDVGRVTGSGEIS